MYDTIVIGAGQAGISIGYYLKQSDQKFIILDKSHGVGESWKDRYDSLVLFTCIALCLECILKEKNMDFLQKMKLLLI